MWQRSAVSKDDVLGDLKQGEIGRCLLRVMTFWGATTRWWESEQY